MRYRTLYSHLRTSISVFLVISLLGVSTPAAPKTIVFIAKDSSESLRFWAYASGLMALLQGRGNGKGQPQEKQEDRDARVASIQIVPGDVTIRAFQRVVFGAVAYDQNGDTVSGVKIKWRTSTPERARGSHITPNGEFRPPVPGTYQIIAEGAGQQAVVTATVEPGERRPQKGEKPIEEKTVSTRDLPEGEATAKLTRPKSRAKRAHAAPAPAPMFQSNAGWDNTNYWSADDPGNTPGTPPGSPADTGAGSANFQFGAPVLSLPGRGNDLSLSLAYNSRLWNKAGAQMTYDIDRGWPAPGWALGFGKVLFMGTAGGSMIVEQDGSRRPFTGTITNYGYGLAFNGHTTDGSLIDYSTWTTSTGIMTSAIVNLPNGTVIYYYTTGPGGVYPSTIIDPQGNVISISYVNNTGPKIQSIWDSMGRTINFHYDSLGLLTAVTAPGFNGGAARTLVRFTYQQKNISPGFAYPAITSTIVRDYNPWMIKAIFYPATSTGYWFGDSDSYSSYGMLAKVVEQRGMTFSGAPLNQQGTISQGSLTRRETYNYPLTANFSLTNAPTYTTCVESWSRDGTNIDSATTTYEVFENTSPRTVTITLPNGSKTKQFSHNLPGNVLDGLVYQDQILNSSNTVLQSSYVHWQAGQYDSPRPWKVETTNELGQTQRTEYTYAGVFNQATEIREYDFSGNLVRSRRTQFLDDWHYNDRKIRNLPTVVELYGPDNTTRVARTEYTYDGQPLQDAPNVYGHSETHNPYAPQWEQCDCGLWDHWQIECLQWNCYWMTNYDPMTDYRGNITQITSYANAVNLTGAVIETRRYDITGNVVKESSSCCDETSYNFNFNTNYAFPLSETRGSATDPYKQIKISRTFDYNTSLPLTATDPNGRTSQTTYDLTSLRPASAIASTGAHTDHSYNDSAMSITSTTYLAAGEGGGIAEQRVKLLNGRSQIRQEQSRGASGVWDLIDVQYDVMGNVLQRSRPYRSGDTILWTTITYDALGREAVVTTPDGSVNQTFYNEASRPSVASSTPGETRRVQDAWGRERWGRFDSLGQLVEVVEPDPNGNGSVASNGMVTTYAYNALGKVTNVTQGSQTRLFKYDSLGRVVAQKMAEASGTLNDAGSYVGGSGTWSEVFTYDSRSNVTSRTDARGVKTILTYNSDPLNRLQSMSFNTSGFGDTANPILAAATVTYSYRTKSSPSDLKDIMQVASIATSGVSTESYQYDTEGRISSKTLTLNSRSSYPMVTDYIYDSLDRTVDLRYPAQYGNGSQLRKVVHHNYDEASRLSSINYDSQAFASNISYNAASQTTSLNVGNGTNQMVENYGYHAQTGLLASQTVARTASPSTYLMNLAYDYVNANGKRTGQLTKITNNLDNNKNRGYEYDALGRLKRATGGQNVNWAQRYLYDRYGNRTFAFAHTADQYIRNFYLKALVRQPNSTELNNWLNTLQTAYAQGPSQFWTAMQNLGAAVFTSQEYINRNRTDHWYVYDLYQAYLWRDPDAGGWAHWEANTAAVGRNATRAGFDWSQEFEMHVGGTSPYASPGGPVPADGWASMHYDYASNRVNDPGWNYDAAGNQTRVQRGAGWQRYQYDAANRLVKIKADDNVTVISSYTYGDTNQRLMIEEGGVRTYHASEGGSTIAEFVETGASTTPAWSKSYVYLGPRLLSTLTPNGSGGEAIQHHHPDRLGTRLVSNPANGTSFEQVTLPFGTALTAESTGSTNRRFTTYDRSSVTGLDYALNRHYDSDQGRFTQVDPIGMRSVSMSNPQTLNLYAYCANDPINHSDPSGLGFFSFLKKLFKGIGNLIAKILSNKWVLLVVGIVLGAVAGLGFYWAATITTQFFLPAAITLAAMSAALIVAAFHPNFLRVIRTIGAIASAVQGAVGLINRTINGRVLATTPPWNPGGGVGPVNNFQGGSGVRAPLTSTQKSAFDAHVALLLLWLKDKNSACAKFLRTKLGISGTRIAKTVEGIRPFNGYASTISLKNAGLIPQRVPISTYSVATLFAAVHPGAAAAGYATKDDKGATLLDVYFGAVFTPQDILHETLHVFLGANDSQLAARLGVTIIPNVDTSAISDALKNGGCGY